MASSVAAQHCGIGAAVFQHPPSSRPRQSTVAQLARQCFSGGPRLRASCGAEIFKGEGRVSVAKVPAGSSKWSLTSSFTGAPLPRPGPVKTQKSAEVRGGALGAQCNIQLSSPYTLNWVLLVASVFLMLAAKTNVYKQLLVPLLALHMPQELVNWIKGEYGMWTAFLAVLVRLFYGIPAQLELPFAAFLAVLSAPGQIMDFRRSPAAAIVGLVLGTYVAWTHFRETKTVDGSLNSSVLATTIANIVVLVVPIVFIVKGYAG